MTALAPDRSEVAQATEIEQLPAGMSVLHNQLGRFVAAIGLLCVVVAEVLPARSPQKFLAGFGFFALLVAAIMALAGTRGRQKQRAICETSVGPLSAWRWTLIGLGVIGAIVVQTWFRSGTLIAGGDIAPPIGTAWIQRIFADYGWSGNNLGGAQANQGLLPFAVLDSLVHTLGGSGALAQRIWYSLLVAGIMVAAGALARSLGLTPKAGIVVAILFFFNPMTLSQVGINDVFLVAMLLLAALPAAVISYGRGNLRTWQLSSVFVISAPLCGYAYSNPPLVAMIAIVTAASPLLVWIRFGGNAAGHSVRGLLIGSALTAAASAYWLIPSEAAVANLATGSLSSLSAWAFTETRSTLANGLWLNTNWAWQFPQYFPYAHYFEDFPLILARPFVPLVAFGGLIFPSPSDQRGQRIARLTGALAIGVLGIALLSTGTNSPGDLLFDPLYRLPYGWLLREPGRFLMAASLGFALLAGILVDRLRSADRAATSPARSSSFTNLSSTWRGLPISTGVACLVVIIAIATAFPLWTGAVVIGPHKDYPSTHVIVPTYWGAEANYLNSSSAPPGRLLVLPPDDFYQMPYTWYYGNDGFIPNLLIRHVVVPSGQGYDSVSSALLNAVALEAQALVSGRWVLAGQLLNAIGTPLVLVRGDINSSLPGRNIIPPVALAKALAADPEMRRINSDGPLSLYQILPRYDLPPTNYATMATTDPDLQALATLPTRTALISSPPKPGRILLVSPSPPAAWSLASNALTTQLHLPSGWDYAVRSIAIESAPAKAALPTTAFSHESSGGTEVRLSIPLSRSLLPNGNFQQGVWSSVGNCDNAIPVNSSDTFGGTVIPHGAPDGGAALQLSASVDSACESVPLAWTSGPLDIRLSSRSRSGSSPRLCLWEEPIARCAATPSLPSGGDWSTSNAIVTPDAGTQTISLFVYADATTIGSVSITQYADVSVRSVVSVPNTIIVGTPVVAPGSGHLVESAEGYSSQWTTPSHTTHVLVDGMRNGWIVPGISTPAGPVTFLPAEHEKRNTLVLTIVMVAIAMAIWRLTMRRFRRLRSEPN